MSIKHKDIEIPPENPFEKCKLGREKYAKILTGIVETYSDGFVLAVNNEWGTGKTTFVKMWQQHLENQNFKTRYFNAWENDYDSNPLAALISELKMPSPEVDDQDYLQILKKGAVIAKSVLPAIVKAWAKRHIDVDELTEIWNADTLKGFTEASTEILKEQINEYEKKKNGLGEFRNELESYIAKYNVGKPLVFIIDELDRCRPDYAVEVLELVKHFFNVHGIVFVLSIDKVQLGNAVKGFYGSESINADEYLRRFIDLEFVIPSPQTSDFCIYLYDKFKFDEFLDSGQRRKNKDSLNQHDKSLFLVFSTNLFEKSNLTLRQQEKVYAHARVVLNLQSADTHLFPEIYIFLVFIRFFNYELFKNIKEYKLEPQELVENLIEYSLNLIKEENSKVLSMLALLAHMYNNSFHSLDMQAIHIDSFYRLNVLSILPLSPNYNVYDELSRKLMKLKDGYFRNITLAYLLEVIDLTSNQQ